MDILFKNDQPIKAVPGGSTFNSIISLGRAAVPCVMVTDIGGDHVGDIICDYLRSNGVSTEYICRHQQMKTHLSLAFLDENNDAQYAFYKDHAAFELDGPLPHVTPDDVLLFGSYFAINPAIRSVVSSLLRQAHDVGAWLYYDINFRKAHITELPQVLPSIEQNMRWATVVRGSMEDFGYLYGLDDPRAIYARVQPLCDTLILTNGAKAIHLFTPEDHTLYQVQPIETVSTVGAGDNFNAGFIYALLQGQSDPAARIAMAQRWSQDVCRQIGNNISPELVQELLKIRSANNRLSEAK